jgi:hypothetical protein
LPADYLTGFSACQRAVRNGYKVRLSEHKSILPRLGFPMRPAPNPRSPIKPKNHVFVWRQASIRTNNEDLSMLRMPKTISALALGVALSAAFVMPAEALSLIQPAYETQAQNSGQRGYPASAFAAGTGEDATPDGYALSQAEINHVKWCAARYASYHPTDNSYLAPAGTRSQCRSPY